MCIEEGQFLNKKEKNNTINTNTNKSDSDENSAEMWRELYLNKKREYLKLLNESGMKEPDLDLLSDMSSNDGDDNEIKSLYTENIIKNNYHVL